MFGYIFGTKPQPDDHVLAQKTLDAKPVLLKTPTQVVIPMNKKVFLVQNKNSEAVIGVYSCIEKAKKAGNKSTFNNCRIIEFKINENCTHLNKIVYESA